jgi:hypothetical protein
MRGVMVDTCLSTGDIGFHPWLYQTDKFLSLMSKNNGKVFLKT